MEKEVLIHVNGMQLGEMVDSNQPIEVISTGLYYYKNGHHYLVFDMVEDGIGEKTQSLMKFKDSYLEVNKKGAVNTRMIFEKNKKTKSFYVTPFGSMNIGISTTDVSLKEKEDSIEVKASYALDINDCCIGDCCISLLAQPKNTPLGLSR